MMIFLALLFNYIFFVRSSIFIHKKKSYFIFLFLKIVQFLELIVILFPP